MASIEKNESKMTTVLKTKRWHIDGPGQILSKLYFFCRASLPKEKTRSGWSNKTKATRKFLQVFCPKLELTTFLIYILSLTLRFDLELCLFGIFFFFLTGERMELHAGGSMGNLGPKDVLTFASKHSVVEQCIANEGEK